MWFRFCILAVALNVYAAATGQADLLDAVIGAWFLGEVIDETADRFRSTR